jgi:hypothetical protein
MNKIYLLLGGALAGAILLTPMTANAQLSTFAQFRQVTNNRPFIFTNAGSGSTFSLISTLVNFTFLVENGYGSGIGDSVNAHMTITSTVDATVTATGTAPNRNFEQPMTSIIIQFIADTPVNGNTNLLTIVAGAGATSSGGLLTGREGRSTGNFDGSEMPGNGDSITMTSDFLNFASTTQRDYSISLNAVTPVIGLNANGYLNNFSANATGTFSSDPPPAMIPEPSTLALVVLTGISLLTRRRCRKSLPIEPMDKILVDNG